MNRKTTYYLCRCIWWHAIHVNIVIFWCMIEKVFSMIDYLNDLNAGLSELISPRCVCVCAGVSSLAWPRAASSCSTTISTGGTTSTKRATEGAALSGPKHPPGRHGNSTGPLQTRSCHDSQRHCSLYTMKLWMYLAKEVSKANYF